MTQGLYKSINIKNTNPIMTRPKELVDKDSSESRGNTACSTVCSKQLELELDHTSSLKKAMPGWQKHQKQFYQEHGDSWKAVAMRDEIIRTR